MLKVYHSNRLERLLDQLVAATAAPLSGPLVPEWVVTQSQGMARWVALGLAERRSIAANIEFVLPATFIWRLFAEQLAGLGERSTFDRQVLVWRLMALLPERLETPGFEPLARYLADERPELKRYQLCRRIADVFDQYLVYRPDLILEWEASTTPTDDWQARLWRLLSTGEAPHRARLMSDFLQGRFALSPEALPERICLFGIPSLPPIYLEVLAKLATFSDIHLFVLNPCLQFWGDIEDLRTIARLRQKRARLNRPLDEDYLTSGNSLLASLGRQGRDFIDALHGHAAEEEEAFEAPTSVGLLGVLQADMLTLTERGREAPALPLDPVDTSLQVHACHSPLREVEVLHDQLLARFADDETLRPQDVVVMAPDIEQYAPYIEAVFGAASEERRIPWSIADLSRQSEHPVVQAFLDLLQLPGSRFTANEVLSLLENPAVLRRHGLSADDLETVRHWVRESGIRWGLDANARAALELPPEAANTWSFGFRRLFLGYAMADAGERLFGEVAPYRHVEGQAAVILGRLRSFIERLESFAGRLGRPRTATAWAALIHEMLEAFFQPESDDAEPLQIIRDVAAELVTETERAGFTEAFGVEVLRDYLGRLTESGTEQRFLTGRLTFCAMVPMRSLPFRVIALIGMNDGAFPRQQRAPGFDRIAAQPRRGDRSRREDDRYLFLEALISAREQLYISYVGRSIRDNSALLPSVLVAELLDYIDQAFTVEGGAARTQLITEHPLQPFSPRYFTGEEALFSYAGEWLPATRAQDAARQAAEPFCAAPLVAASEADEGVELEALCRFFRHPARAFLRERLGLRLREGPALLEDSEPFTLGGLERHRLQSELLDHLLADGDVDAWRALLKARGQLPAGRFGERWLDTEVTEVEALAERIRPRLSGARPAREVDLAGAGWRLTGWLDGLTEHGRVGYRAGNVKGKDRIELWLKHLVLNAVRPEGCPCVSRLIGRDGETVMAPVSAPEAQLEQLIQLYRQGQQAPLPLMPQSALAYAEALGAGKDPLKAAEKVWRSGERHRGEEADADYQLAFRGRDPLEGPFAELAEAVYGPLVAALDGEETP